MNGVLEYGDKTSVILWMPFMSGHASLYDNHSLLHTVGTSISIEDESSEHELEKAILSSLKAKPGHTYRISIY